MSSRLRDLQVAPLPIVCAFSLVVANLLGVVVLRYRYDPGLLEYWKWYGGAVVAAAVLVAILPFRALRELPERCRALILRPSPLAFAAAISLAGFVLALIVQVVAFSRASSTADELSQLFHARMLADGMLSLPVDPNPEFFAIDNIVDSGRWYSQYPIGGVLALLPGVLVRAPWLITPIVGALCIAGVYHFARIAFGEVQGRVCGLIFAQTQNLIFMSGTYLNHVPTLACAVGLLIGLAEWERAGPGSRRYLWAAVCGLSLGLMATVRQLDAIAVTCAAGVFQLYVIRGDLRRFAELGVQSIAGIVGASPVFLANWLTTGSPLRFGYDVAWGSGHRIGFHIDPHGDPHTLARGLGYASRYVSELNFATLGWPIPFAVLAFVGLVTMRKTRRWDALLFALMGMQLGAYALYWGLGEFLGPRFLFTVLPAIVILVARAPFHLADRFGARAATAGIVAYALCIGIGWTTPQAGSVRFAAKQVSETRLLFRLDIAGDVKAAGVHDALVFVSEQASTRILHRMWGLGFPREEAAQIFTRHDACSILAAIHAADRDSTSSVSERLAKFRAAIRPLPPGYVLGRRDRQLRFASDSSMNKTCMKDLDDDTFTPGLYGPALVLNEWDAEGRIGGDVVYVQDLGDHNEVLRKRFADRKWYRYVVTANGAKRTLSTQVVPY